MAIKRFKAYVTEAASGARPQDSAVEGDKLEPRAEGEKNFKAKHKIEVTKHPVAGDHQFNGDRAEITEEKYLNQKGTGESDDGYADAGLFDKATAAKLAKKHKGKAVKDAGGKFLVQLDEDDMEDEEDEELEEADQTFELVDMDKSTAATAEKLAKKFKLNVKVTKNKHGLSDVDVTGSTANIKKFLNSLPQESVQESEEDEELTEGAVVDQLKDIVSKKSAKKVKFGNGKSEEIDMTTASALLKMLDKLNPANKAKAEKMLEKSPEGMFQLLDVAFGGGK
jgi:hypothetical protein